MRLLREIPEVEQKIEEGKLNLTIVTQASRFFKHEKPALSKKKEILESLEGKSTREAEKKLFSYATLPQPLPKEQVRVVSETYSEVKFIADEKLVQDLEKLKGLLAHKYPNMSMAQLVRMMTDIALKELDPAKEPKKVMPQRIALAAQKPTAMVRREVWRKAPEGCSYKDPQTGKVCGSHYALQIDHIKPYAMGGETKLENLRLLCATHNRYVAIQAYGQKKMRQYFKLE